MKALKIFERMKLKETSNTKYLYVSTYLTSGTNVRIRETLQTVKQTESRNTQSVYSTVLSAEAD